MNGIFKKLFSLVLSVAVLLAMLPLSAAVQVRAAQPTANAVEGLTDMGKLLAEASELEQEVSADTYPSGYSLIDLQLESKVATVEYTAMEDATVIVAVYSEDGRQMRASGNAPACAEENTVQVQLTGSIPSYFQVAAYLVRTVDLAPLCSPLQTSRYTKDMQTLLKSKVGSYPKDRVINLDEDKTTNFMVLHEGVAHIQSTQTVNRFVSVDRENKRYVIENADASITGLQQGDTFVHNYAQDDWIIAKVETVTLDGTTVTIQGSDPELEEVFSHVKIEIEGTAEQLEIDEDTLGENVTYQGISQADPETGTPELRTRSLEIEDSDTIDIPVAKFEIELEVEAESGNVSAETKTTLSAQLGIRIKYDFYQVNSQNLTQMRVDTGLHIEGTAEGKVTGKAFELGDWTWKPIPGVSVGFEPFIGVELSGEVTIALDAGLTTELYYDEAANGYRSSAPKPIVTPEVEIDGELFVGLDMNPTLEVLGGLLFDADVTAMVGLFYTGEPTGTNHGEVSQIPENGTAERPKQLHSCAECIDGEIHAGVKLGFEVELAGQNILSSSEKTLLLAYKLSDYYYCYSCVGEHPLTMKGLGFCPQRRFLITVEALDERGDPIQNGVIVADSLNGTVEMGTTNSNGVTSNYIPAGIYTFHVRDNTMQTNTVTVTGTGKVRIDGENLFFSPTDPGSALSPVLEKIVDAGEVIATGSCGENATWSLTSGGFLNVSGTGEVTSNPWTKESVNPRVAVFQEGITGLGDGLFSYESSLFSVTLPNTLKTIGDSTFYYTDIDAAVIPVGVTKIGEAAFSSCRELENLVLPDGLTQIGKSAFYGCSRLSSVVLPRGITRIAESTFSGCRGLTAVSIPNTVTVIERNAFNYCEALTDVNIHHSVTAIEAYAFSNTGLTKVVLDDAVKELGASAFSYCKALQSIRLPSELTEIPDSLLYRCEQLKSVAIPSNVTKIGASAFSGCATLADVNIPAGVTEIGASAFSGCGSLSFVHIPDAVSKIGVSTFKDCTGLETVRLPAGLTKLDNRIFEGCTSLLAISIPATVQEIGEYVFAQCESLTSVALPYGITKVSDYLFSGCLSLASVTLPSTVTEIGNGAFGRCGFVDLSIPGHITKLGYNAFQGCADLQSIVVPGSITQIPSYCFDGCSSLVSVTLPETVTTLDTAAFQSCTSLQSIALPENVTSISGWLFNECSALAEISMPQHITKIGTAAFQYCTSLTSIDLPDAITEIKNHTFYESGLESIEIPEGVTSISYSVFSGSENLKTVVLPTTLQFMDDSIFFGCSSLVDINIPEGITSIPYRSFYKCISLVDIYLPDGLTEIGHNAFYDCASLESVRIPDSLQRFGEDAFAGCGNLQDIYIPEGVVSIGGSAFLGCDSLSGVLIPKTVTSMGTFAFAECDNLSVAYFEGDAPSSLVYAWFIGNEMTIYYPAGNETWTKDVMDSCETIGPIKRLTWIPYTPAATTGEPVAASSVEMVQEQIQQEAPQPVVAETEQLTVETVTAEVDAPVLYGTVGGAYTQQVVDGKTVKSAVFTDLTPGQSYLMLAVADVQTEALLAPENLLYVTQVTAGEDGTVTQSYIQRTSTALSFVMLCGASDRNLQDAAITFPAMSASDQACAVDPVVVYNGKQLTEGVDYRIEGDVSYTKAGTYSCTIRGMYGYTGTVQCTYTVADYVAGDFDGNGAVDNKDVVYLLWHTLFPTDYPVAINADITADSTVDNKDVVYLLWHTLFPEDYPLTKS